jgi:ABC-type multidrug transport system fused ATPase/permease subunit
MKISEFGVFVVLLTQVFRPLKGVSKTNSKIQKGLAGSDRVFRVLDQHPNIVDKEGAAPVAPLKDAIEFRNVTFSYRPDAPSVLKNLNLRVGAGKAVAFVGETGSGKSTLVNLLPRFYDPTDGGIFYDGVDLRDVAMKSLRSHIAIITQETVLFDDTIANNIAYGSTSEVPRAAIEEAAKAAKAYKFIMEKPEGFDTMIGSRGVRLSGGERQRIAIARAIVKNSPILILDEATSALDSETEALIQEALINVIKGRTVFVIAHRLSTIQNCDEIYVLDRERMGFAEHGTHDELLKKGGLYANYYNRQFGGNDSK